MDNLNVGAVHHFEKVSENIIALYARFDASHITIYDLNHQKIIAKSISVPNVLHKSLIPVDYNYSNFFHIGNKLCYFERWDQTIYEIDTSRIVPKFRVEFSDMNFLDITKITNGKDYKKNFWEWYNGDWVRGLDVVSCIDGNLIIEFSYLKERYTAIYDTSNKGLELFKFNDLDILSKSKYKTSYINHSNKIILTYDIVEQEEVIRYLEKNFNSNLEMNLNPYILQLCLKK